MAVAGDRRLLYYFDGEEELAVIGNREPAIKNYVIDVWGMYSGES